MDRYELAKGHNRPKDIKLSESDLKAMVKPSDITIYDNLYAKPPLSGEGQRFSIAVLFKVKDNWIYSGQYCWETNKWDVLPSVSQEEQKETGRGTFTDREVEYWFHHPESIDLFKKYSEEIKTDRCRDQTSRLDPFDIASFRFDGVEKI
jgi:hypothetical protein